MSAKVFSDHAWVEHRTRIAPSHIIEKQASRDLERIRSPAIVPNVAVVPLVHPAKSHDMFMRK